MLAIAMLGRVCGAAGPRADQTASTPAFRNNAPGVKFVGSAACATCHQDIYDEYARTDMARTISPADDPAQLARANSHVSIYDKDRGSYFDVSHNGNHIDQGEYALDSSGHELYRHQETLAYAIGAGANGWTYLIERGSYLFQAPLSFYAKTGSWGLSPGHELGFNRAITTGCIVCHSGRALPVPHRDAAYQRPAFSELTIGCENCHGPGELHVNERSKGAPVEGSIDTSIVNPARLPGWLADNICMFCHQEGDARVLQPGRDYLDYRPGTPLDRTIVILTLADDTNTQRPSPLLNHYSLMVSSRCYRDSGGKLGCLTCHDPHVQPSAARAPAYYRSKCLSCHTETSCKLTVAARRRASDDCASCHMPKRQLQTIAHSALTDHRIVRHPGESDPSGAVGVAVAGLAGAFELDAEPGPETIALPPLTRLVALRQLADRGEPYKSQYLATLKQVAPGEPDNPLVLGMLARAAVQDGSSDGENRAIEDLSRAIQSGSTWAPDYDLLGTLLLRAGRAQEAADVVGRGIALAPYTASLYALMAECDEALRKRAAAVDTLERGLSLFPEERSMREDLARIRSTAH